MNIRICEDPACADIEVVVRCRQLDDTVLSLLARLRVYDAKLTGERDGATYVLAAADVLYADTADKKTFLYTSGLRRANAGDDVQRRGGGGVAPVCACPQGKVGAVSPIPEKECLL